MPWLVILAYLLGSIPTAYIAGCIRQGKDIRQIGDSNVGAANAFRELGAKVGVIVGTIDAAKGALAIFIAQAFNAPQLTILMVGAAAVIGHNWSIFIGFRGGRGVSTAIGVLTTLLPLPMLIAGGPAVVALFVRKNATFAAAVLFILLPLACWWLGTPGILVIYGIGLPCLIGLSNLIKTRQTVRASKT